MHGMTAFITVLLSGLFLAYVAALVIEAERRDHCYRKLYLKWLRQGTLGMIASLSIFLALFVIGSTKQEEQQQGESQPLTGSEAFFESGTQTLTSGPDLTAAQYAACFALLPATVTNTAWLTAAPSNAVVHATWTRYGVAEDTFWLAATNWGFVIGTNAVEGVHVSSSGALSFQRRWPKGSPRAREMPDGDALSFLAPLQADLGTVPPRGRFWHAVTGSNSVLMTWEDLCAGRDTNSPVTFQTELFGNGDFTYRYAFTNALALTNFVVGAQHNGGGETYAFSDTGKLVNGLELHWRAFGMLDPNVEDHDGDGLSTYDEVMNLGTDPSMPDTDLDGLSDKIENDTTGLNPLIRDIDGDGIPDGSDPDPLTPDTLDDDNDGLRDAWEIRWFGSTNVTDSADADFNGNGASNLADLLEGVDPSFAACAVTTSQGLHLFTWTALPDATNYVASVSNSSAAVWSCATNVCSLSVTGDFTSAEHTFAVTAYCTNAVATHTATATFRQPSQPNLTVWKIAAPFALDPPSNNAVALERTFRINRVREWQRYFISSGHDSAGPWALDGLQLEWADDTGAAGTNSASPSCDSLRLDLGADAETLTVRLAATRDVTGWSRRPLYLIGWSPAVTFDTNTVFIATTNGPALVVVAGVEDGPAAPGFTVDYGGRPCNEPLTQEETAGYLTPFGTNGVAFSGTTDANGLLTGGTLSAGVSGTYTAATAGGGGGEGGAGGGGGGSQPLPPGPGAGRFNEHVIAPAIIRDFLNFTFGSCPEYPVETLCDKISMYTGWGEGRKELGFHVTGLDGAFSVTNGSGPGPYHAWAQGESSTVMDIRLADKTALTMLVRREPDGFTANGCDWNLAGAGCGCAGSCPNGGCEGGATLGSVRFRVPLGDTGYKTMAGYVWFNVESNSVDISPSIFSVTGDASVSQEFQNAGSTLSRVYCEASGREVRIDAFSNGVSVSVGDYNPAGFSADYVWLITNPGNEMGKVRFEKTVGAVTQKSSLYEFLVYYWRRTDEVTGLRETSWRLEPGTVYDGEFGADNRAAYSPAGQTLSEVRIWKTAVGTNAAPVRETRQREWDGVTQTWRETYLTYWRDDQNELLNGCPKFRYDNKGSWEYLAHDRRGREILRAEPLDGSGQPPFKDAAEPFALANAGAYGAFTARVTVTGYETADAGSYLDSRKPRTVSGYVVRNGDVTLVSREWHAYTRGEAADGHVTLTHRVTRAASQASAENDAANRWNETVAYVDDVNTVPALLRGRALREESADGGLATWAYDFDDSGPQEVLKVTARRATTALPEGIPNVSTFEVETLDAVFGRVLRRETRVLTGGGGSELLSWEERGYDAKGRLLGTVYSDGTCESNEWNCCQMTAIVGRDGTRREFEAVPGDDRVKLSAEVSLGALPGSGGRYPVTETFADVLGRETNSVRRVYSGGNPDSAYAPLSTRTEYPYGTDNFRVTTDPLGVQTVSRSYYGSNSEIEETVSAGVTNRTTQVWGGSTISEKMWRDPVGGEFLSHSSRTKKDWTAGGHEVETVSVSRNGGGWTTLSVTERDMLGREIAVSRAGFGGAMLVTSNAYDGAGRQVSSVMPDGSSEFYAYDALGGRTAVIRAGAGQSLQFDPQDFTLSEVIALDAYVVTETPAWKENGDLGLGTNGVPTAWWDCHAAVSYLPGRPSVTTSVTRVQLTGLSPACLNRTVATDINGVTSVTTESADAGNAAKTTTRVNIATAETGTSVAVAGQEVCSTNSLGAIIAYAFDGFARQTSVTAASGGRTLQTITTYHDDGTVASSAEVCGAVTNVTTYSARQPLQSPEGAYSVTVTDPAGNATVSCYTSYSGTPYSSEGATYPTATALDADGNKAELQTWRDEMGQPDITRWHYDLVAGLVTNKVYADGLGPAYTYTADGRLASRAWARGVTAAYTYTNTAEGLIQTLNYSETTPDVTNSFDLAGRLVEVDDGSGHRTLSYDSKGRLTAETNALAVISRRYDTPGRDAGYDLAITGFAVGTHSVRYGYDGGGRLDQVISVCDGVTNVFRYSFLEGTPLVAGMTNGAGISWARRYEPGRNLIAAVSNFWGASAVSAFGYENDVLGRRTRRVDAAPSLSVTNVFAYNHRSEVTNAAMDAITYAYSYDDIGNCRWATAGAAVCTYAANQLNQYTAVTNDGLSNPVAYDADGNMTRNGGWYYAWDGENNMRRAGTLGLSNGIIRVDNGYDYMKRRVAKTVTVLTGYIPFTGFGQPFSPGEWLPVRTTRFVWDNWNIAAEITVDHNAGTTNVTRYVWGLDLSGSVQGAGGVGGLLAVIEGDGSVYYPCYDANGNVTEYVDESGAIVAHYVYSAFGEITAQSCTMADAFTHRFSTKPFEVETGHSKYQQRDYIPPLARWASFDPIGERGGVNLYGFVYNDSINTYDLIGLWRPQANSSGETCDKCGPEIEAGLTATMNMLKSRFNLLSSAEKAERCSKKYLLNTWDIRFPSSPSGCGSGKCGQSVMVHGKCFDQWKVNYILFGRISSLCDFWRVTMELMVAGQKVIVKPLVDNDWENEYTADVRGFARIGYNWKGTLPYTLPNSTGGFDKCKKCDVAGASDCKYNSAFRTTWP